jgi:copper(I)-binding protein
VNTTTSPRIRRSAALLIAVGLGLSACGSDDASSDTVAEAPAEAGEITITDAWSREPADGQSTSAVYGVVTNGTDETITAIAATTNVSDTVELHEVIMNDDSTMTMQEKEGGYEIAAGESFTFEPGGPHIMVLGIDPAEYPDTVDVVLEFDNGEQLAFTAEVRALDTSMEMDGEMDMDGETDMDGTVEMEMGDG